MRPVSFIGMSSIGKTYWSKKLAERGFVRFSCDEIIATKLEKEFDQLENSTIHDVAAWLGQPYDIQYKENSAKYLQYEQEAMEEIFSSLEELKDKNIVIDTTGSVIYLSPQSLEKLRTLTQTVYFVASDHFVEELYKLYLDHPKPVIWGDSFHKQPDETNQAALSRSYIELLEFRRKKYSELANLRLEASLLRKENFTVNNLMAELKDHS